MIQAVDIEPLKREGVVRELSATPARFGTLAARSCQRSGGVGCLSRIGDRRETRRSRRGYFFIAPLVEVKNEDIQIADIRAVITPEVYLGQTAGITHTSVEERTHEGQWFIRPEAHKLIVNSDGLLEERAVAEQVFQLNGGVLTI